MSGPYDDIINLPHPTSTKHPRMPMSDRAAIFSPFAALTGHAAAIQETARLTKIPGIGKKTAERLLLELKGKLDSGPLSAVSATVPNDTLSDIQNALLALGYSEKETLVALKQIPGDCNVSDGIKMALKTLSKG